jgi:replicative DNA helicase
MVQELNFQAYSDRLPPQNIDAEEAILGGILLDPEAINRVVELLRPEVFYITAHQEIYRAALSLNAQGKPTDLMSVASWLHDRGLLEKVGGQSRLAQLIDRTISAVNIDQYAQLVLDKYLRRKLIQAGTEVAQLGYETSSPLEKVLDQSEQKIFAVTQSRPQRSLIPTADILTSTFSDIESRSLGLVLPGIPCGFYDLDAMTQGFQRSDLIIAAGRPAMGKCLAYDSEIVLADGTVATIKEIYHNRQAKLLTLGSDWQFNFTQPSAFIDDGIKPVFRVTTWLGRSIETTLTHPYLTTQGWQQLAVLKPGDKIAVPRTIPIFGVETLRDCEVKMLAYFRGENTDDKTIPPIVFRLQRSQLALFLNCLFAIDGWVAMLTSGQSKIGYATVSQQLARQIQHLLLRFGIIAILKQQSFECESTSRFAWQLDITDTQSIKTFISEIAILDQEKALMRVQSALANGKCQANHDLISFKVWQQLSLTQEIESRRALAVRDGIIGYSNAYVGKHAPTDERSFILAIAGDVPPRQKIVTDDVYWDEIVSIELVGYKQVYDLTIPETHNFVANDICVHNTSFVLNIARNIAAFHKLPVAIYSLEMSKEQLVYRLLSAEVQIESGRLRAGRISQNEWEPLGHAISVLSQLPIFIDDTPNISVTEMRSKARRLQAEQGGALGLILVDYLQLMENSGSENRVQELSRVTRSLKGLARELNAPIIALSQLSRGVESRTNKRPMMSDLRESGCLTGDTLVTLADSGAQVPIRDLVGKAGFAIWAVDQDTLKLEKASVSHAFSTGTKSVFRLTTRLRRTIRATRNHKFLTIRGWKRLDEIGIGDRIALPCCLTCSPHDIYWDEIDRIDSDGVEEVFDLTVPRLHNFIANDIVVHNSIEQDADLILMLYRDEYYNPDTPDRGIAEVIITKHRNGPIGTLKLLFEPQFTRFRNLATPNRL